MDNDLKDLLGNVKRRLEDRHSTLQQAKEVEMNDRQDFLRRYRKCAENEILPVFRDIEAEASGLLRVNVHDFVEMASVGLEIEFRTTGKHERLSYKGDYKRKTILASVLNKWSEMSGEYEPEALTRQLVSQHVSHLVAYLAKDLP